MLFRDYVIMKGYSPDYVMDRQKLLLRLQFEWEIDRMPEKEFWKKHDKGNLQPKQ